MAAAHRADESGAMRRARSDHGGPTAWADARRRAHAAARPLAAEPVALADALGGVLAVPLTALVSVPSADSSAMDGYAVCGPGPWTVVAHVRAGEPTPGALRPGTACEIATGAPVPGGTSGVVPYEQCERTGQHHEHEPRPSGPAQPGQPALIFNRHVQASVPDGCRSRARRRIMLAASRRVSFGFPATVSASIKRRFTSWGSSPDRLAIGPRTRSSCPLKYRSRRSVRNCSRYSRNTPLL